MDAREPDNLLEGRSRSFAQDSRCWEKSQGNATVAKEKPDESLVTIEIKNNKIVQARRRFNEPVTNEDQEVIDKWNKKFADKEKVA